MPKLSPQPQTARTMPADQAAVQPSWVAATELLQQALARPAAERPAFLAEACAGDSRLRADVDLLLEAAGADAAAPSLPPGTVLGPYHIRSLLGRGGVGEVYQAWDGRLGRAVALKVLLPRFASNATSVQRFEQEARAASALNHPSILTIHDIGRSGSTVYVVSELVPGTTLRARLTGGPLPVSLALSVAAQVAAGLAAAHARGIVHRDIKPENVMVTDEGSVRILDFGLAKLHGADPVGRAPISIAGGIRGTVAYMSPEQARGEPVDHRSDQFALGSLIAELLTGAAPFARGSLAETLAAILDSRPPALPAAAPSALRRVMARCLSREPQHRYASTAALASELARISEAFARRRPLLSRFLEAWPWWGAGALALSVLAASVVAIRRPASAPAGRVRSLAVLPFRVVGGGPDDYLGVGIADVLTSGLARARRALVRPGSASRRYAGPRDPVAAGRTLSVDAVLDGTLTLGARLRVSVRFLRVADGVVLWKADLDSARDDLFGVQDSIAEQVLALMPASLTGERLSSRQVRGTDDPQAYRAYLKARADWNRRTEEGARRAMDQLNEALRRDPTYPQAWAGIADVYLVLGDALTVIPPGQAFPRAREAVRKALELDDGLAEAHASLAHIQMHLTQWSEAESEFKRAIELDPAYATAHHWYAYHLAARGRMSEALVEIEAAQTDDPLSSIIYADRGLLYLYAGQADRALAHCRQGATVDPGYAEIHVCIGRSLLALGRPAEAIAALERATSLGATLRESMVHALAVAGRTAEARRRLARLQRTDAGYVSPFGLALAHTGLGETDQAFRWLDRAVDDKDADLLMIAVEPRLRSLHGDPRFAAVLLRLGLPPPAAADRR